MNKWIKCHSPVDFCSKITKFVCRVGVSKFMHSRGNEKRRNRKNYPGYLIDLIDHNIFVIIYKVFEFYYIFDYMAKVCEICKKSTTYGKRIRHHHADKWRYRAPKTSRNWKPNLRTAKIVVDGVTRKVKVCMKCYKSLSSKVS